MRGQNHYIDAIPNIQHIDRFKQEIYRGKAVFLSECDIAHTGALGSDKFKAGAGASPKWY
jgi:hypothetical protein